jgi:hypothetical protein
MIKCKGIENLLNPRDKPKLLSLLGKHSATNSQSAKSITILTINEEYNRESDDMFKYFNLIINWFNK